MKKRLLLITLFLIVGLIIIFIMPISKKNNWIYKLPNNYEIEKSSETDIYLKKDNKVFIEDYIAEFSYSDNFLLLKCVNTDINIKFYIIDTRNDSIYGPYLDYQEFDKVKNEIVLEKVGDWMETINYKD